jgi:hypothetical protein
MGDSQGAMALVCINREQASFLLNKRRLSATSATPDPADSVESYSP